MLNKMLHGIWLFKKCKNEDKFYEDIEEFLKYVSTFRNILPPFSVYNKLRQLTQMDAFSSFKELEEMTSLGFSITQKSTTFIRVIIVPGNN